MTLNGAIDVLKRHNKWRRGSEIDMELPSVIGLAIDTVIAELEQELPQGYKCTCCGSEKVFLTKAVHCNLCAMTIEI